MAIIKNKEINKVNIMNEVVPLLDLQQEENLENIKFNKEEYLSLLEEGRQKGYEEGLVIGKKEGYENGVKLLNEETQKAKELLEEDISKVKVFLEKESIQYIDTFKQDIYSLISKTINKVFFEAIDNELIMKAYLQNLLKHLSEKYKSVKIICNSKTFEILQEYSFNEEIQFSIDNILDNFDIKVISDSENIEFYLKDEFDRMSDLFC